MSGRTGDNPSLTVAVVLCGIPMVAARRCFQAVKAPTYSKWAAARRC